MADVKPTELNNLLVAKAQSTRDAKEQRTERHADARQDRKERQQDSVELSQDARSLREMQARLESSESFDQARVDRIKQAIQNGQYPIDNQRLAEKFYELENNLNQ